jgi:hypothetical protein
MMNPAVVQDIPVLALIVAHSFVLYRRAHRHMARQAGVDAPADPPQ